MKQIKIALGTTSIWKINFVKKVLNDIRIKFDIIPVKTDSKVSDQPITEDETILGSINRAKQAIKESQDTDIGLGIEVGYHKEKNGDYEMFCYATIVEKDGNILSSCSHKFLLPKMYQEVLKNNKEMHIYVDEYYKKDNHPATQYLAKMIDEREPFIIEAVRGVIIKYFRKEDF
jgi:non-canonical (house-cleaning) NTP pyrophosphatase